MTSGKGAGAELHLSTGPSEQGGGALPDSAASGGIGLVTILDMSDAYVRYFIRGGFFVSLAVLLVILATWPGGLIRG